MSDVRFLGDMAYVPIEVGIIAVVAATTRKVRNPEERAPVVLVLIGAVCALLTWFDILGAFLVGAWLLGFIGWSAEILVFFAPHLLLIALTLAIMVLRHVAHFQRTPRGPTGRVLCSV